MESSTAVASIAVLLYPMLKRDVHCRVGWIGKVSEVIRRLGPSFA